MEEVHSFEMSVNLYYTTRRHIPEEDNLHSHRLEDLRAHKYLLSILEADLLAEVQGDTGK
jgi:hypothetical protein